MKKRPLDYERKSNRKRGPLWLVVFFAATAYGIGMYFSYSRTFGEMFGIMYIVTIIVIGVVTVVAGMHYGTQDKDFWA